MHNRWSSVRQTSCNRLIRILRFFDRGAIRVAEKRHVEKPHSTPPGRASLCLPRRWWYQMECDQLELNDINKQNHLFIGMLVRTDTNMCMQVYLKCMFSAIYLGTASQRMSFAPSMNSCINTYRHQYIRRWCVQLYCMFSATYWGAARQRILLALHNAYCWRRITLCVCRFTACYCMLFSENDILSSPPKTDIQQTLELLILYYCCVPDTGEL